MKNTIPQWATILSVIVMIMIIVTGVFLVSSSMIPALVWGAILAIALRPIQRKMAPYMNDTKSAILIVVLLCVISIGGISLMSWNIADEMGDLSKHVISDTVRMPNANSLPAFLKNNVHFQSFMTEHTHTDRGVTYLSIPHMDGSIKEYSGKIYGHFMSGLHAISGLLETLSFTFLSLFCFLSAYKPITQQILNVSNKLIGRQDVIIHIVKSVRGTVSGLVLVGLAEGIIISPAFIFCHTPHPAIFTAIISVAAMIPFVGPPIAIIAGLITYASVGLTSSIIVTAIALFVLFAGDHFVRPIFIGGATQLPFLATLIGILGGMHAFGFVGLFIGPSIMACGHMLWCELACEDKIHEDLK